MEAFTVRLMAYEDTQWMVDKALELGRGLCHEDVKGFWAVDNTGFFVGEVNGEIISCIACLKYTDTFAIISMYMVDKRFRGMGYGLKTFKTAMSSVPTGCNVSLVAMPNMVAEYERCGFIRAWVIKYNTFDILNTARIECSTPKTFTIHPVSQVSPDVIIKYDSKCFFTSRPEFIMEWVFSQRISRAAFAAKSNVGSGEVIGLIVVREPLSPGDPAYRVGPFYANSNEVATCLLKYTCAFLRDKGLSKEKLGIYIPEKNPTAIVLADRLQSTNLCNLVCMFTGSPPSCSFGLVYGISSPVSG